MLKGMLNLNNIIYKETHHEKTCTSSFCSLNGRFTVGMRIDEWQR